jgi:hypothetical protein
MRLDPRIGRIDLSRALEKPQSFAEFTHVRERRSP